MGGDRQKKKRKKKKCGIVSRVHVPSDIYILRIMLNEHCISEWTLFCANRRRRGADGSTRRLIVREN